MITYQRVTPHPPLSVFIESLWLYEGDMSLSARERRLPDGSMELVVNLRDDEIRVYDRQKHDQFQSHRGGVISGAHSQFSLIDATSQCSMIGAHFKPGGAFPFLALPAAELHNEVVALDVVWGAAAAHLREQLLEARTSEERLSLLEQFLRARLAPSRIGHPAIPLSLKALQSTSAPTISAVTEQIGMSQTRFIQVFRDAVGLTPKQFSRIQRFQEVLRRLERGVPGHWAEIALDCGYFDQAHFNHDFQAFAGLTPGMYFSLRREHRNHVLFCD